METTIQDTYSLQSSEQLRAIAEPTRWRMLNLLIAKPLTGSQLARLLGISRPRAHYHLKTLEKAGLIQFVEERQRQHMIERYYRAIAVTYRTDNVLAQAGQAAGVNGDGSQASAALQDIIHSMLAVVDADVSNPANQPQLGKLIFNWQGDLKMSQDQFESIRQELRQVLAHLNELERQNLTDPPAAGANNLLSIRYTLLLTPIASLDLNGTAPGR